MQKNCESIQIMIFVAIQYLKLLQKCGYFNQKTEEPKY
jgi:hypothetical protein